MYILQGNWVWTDGSAWDFTGWGKGEPNDNEGNEDCLEMNHLGNGDWGWNDNGCSDLCSYVCKTRK